MWDLYNNEVIMSVMNGNPEARILAKNKQKTEGQCVWQQKTQVKHKEREGKGMSLLIVLQEICNITVLPMCVYS